MGFVSDVVGGLTGKTQRKASKKASEQQQEAAQAGIDLTRETRDLARGDLQPFTQAGSAALDPLQNLVLDPQAQQDFITNNPFFDSLLNEERQNTLQNRAASGKLGSGGTLKALDQNVLRIGQGLVDNQTNKLSNLANLGQASAAGQANVAQQAGRQGSDLLTQQGNAAAAGTVGQANARNAPLNNLLSIGNLAAKF
jgi:hypothetical protein